MNKNQKIRIRYEAIDGFTQTRVFYTLKFAARYAQERVGEFPEMGAWYAISGDGVGKVTVEGASLADLFPARTSLQMSREQAEVDADGRDNYTGEDDLTERAIELRNDEWASRQTEIDRMYGM